MAWTYAQLKAAILSLSTVPETLEEIAAAINAQSSSIVAPVTWKAIKTIVQISLSWSNIVVLARAADGSAANKAAINAYETNEDLIIYPNNSSAIVAFQAGLDALEAHGSITSADVANIHALFLPTAVPNWVPPVTAGDIQTAMVQP